jgi:hypothetical protein
MTTPTQRSTNQQLDIELAQTISSTIRDTGYCVGTVGCSKNPYTGRGSQFLSVFKKIGNILGKPTLDHGWARQLIIISIKNGTVEFIPGHGWTFSNPSQCEVSCDGATSSGDCLNEEKNRLEFIKIFKKCVTDLREDPADEEGFFDAVLTNSKELSNMTARSQAPSHIMGPILSSFLKKTSQGLS